MKFKKPYKGFSEIKKPNLKKCYYCGKKNCDWKRDYSIHDIEFFPSLVGMENYHKICVFKKRHYGIHPDKWTAWQKENKIAVEKTLERDNNTCQLCFGEVQKYYIPYLQKELVLVQRGHIKTIHMTKKEILSFMKRKLATAKKKKVYVHHIQPVKDGGSNELRNLVTLCRYCHDMIERNTEMGARFGISQELYDLICKRYDEFKKKNKKSS